MGEIMKLIEIVTNINQYTDDHTIYASRDPSWLEESEAVVAKDLLNGSTPEEAGGMEYLLEVWLALEVIDVWSEWRGGRIPSTQQMCEAIIYYASHDAYIQPEDEK
jgi:hypothetical protein